MWKYFLIVIILWVAITAQAENAGKNEKDLFHLYREDQTFENFIKAAIHFNSQKEESKDPESDLMLSYLYYIELENQLKILGNELDSLNNRTKFQYANLLLELKRYEKSIEIYNTLNETTPAWSCPWRHKGEAYFKSGKLEDAEYALLKAIETRIEHYDAYVMLADVQKEIGKYEEALTTLETGLSYKGKDIEDPEEEVMDLDVKFLYLELLKLNNKKEKIKPLEQELLKIAPEDERWNNLR